MMISFRAAVVGIGLVASFFTLKSQAQPSRLDSLKQTLSQASSDDDRMNLLIEIGNIYFNFKPDSSLVYFEKGIALAQQSSVQVGRATVLNMAGTAARMIGDYPKALRYQLEALELARQRKSEGQLKNSMSFVGTTYLEFGEFRQALRYFLQERKLREAFGDPAELIFNDVSIGRCYRGLSMIDSTLFYLNRAQTENQGMVEDKLLYDTFIMIERASVLNTLGQYDSAIRTSRIGLVSINQYHGASSIHRIPLLLRMAEAFHQLGQTDSAFYYARLSYAASAFTQRRSLSMESAALLASLHAQAHRMDSAFHYQAVTAAMRDSLYGPVNYKKLQLVMLSEQQREEAIRQQQEEARNRIRIFILSGSLVVFLFIILLLYRNNRTKQRAKNQIEQAYQELQAAQKQLVHAEKMASLGELTAGIAHEIQNPLNFVKNFSEINVELADELLQTVSERNWDDVQQLAKDIKDNEQKIIHHGNRADGIVKSMLLHSRTGTGQKALIDINALCDEYLRLAYHGFRAKDNTFHVAFQSHLDPHLPKVTGVAADIGRVLLNLLNNAFHAVAGMDDALVELTTDISKGRVAIRVSDNGPGVPDNIRDKIFQPFFTTKPTGQGTGLGLSISHDIVRGHGGELSLEPRTGGGSVFVVTLPPSQDLPGKS